MVIAAILLVGLLLLVVLSCLKVAGDYDKREEEKYLKKVEEISNEEVSDS